MSAEYVRRFYRLDYKRGDRLVFDANGPDEAHGVLVSFPGQYLGIRFDGETGVERLHPTYKISREGPSA